MTDPLAELDNLNKKPPKQIPDSRLSVFAKDSKNPLPKKASINAGAEKKRRAFELFCEYKQMIDIAEEIGVTSQAVSDWSYRYNWRVKRGQLESKVADNIVEKIEDKALAQIQTLLQVTENMIAVISQANHIATAKPKDLETVVKTIGMLQQIRKLEQGVNLGPVTNILNVTFGEALNLVKEIQAFDPASLVVQHEQLKEQIRESGPPQGG